MATIKEIVDIYLVSKGMTRKGGSDNDLPGVICGCYWKQCISYNDETKHLVGTKEDCPEFYKWWEE